MTRDKLKRKEIITKLETDWSKYKKKINQINIELRKAKTNYFSSKIADQKCNPKKVWRAINNLLGKQNKNSKVTKSTEKYFRFLKHWPRFSKSNSYT